MKEFRYSFDPDKNKEIDILIESLKKSDDIFNAALDNAFNELVITTTLKPEDLEKKIASIYPDFDFSNRYKELRFNAEIDCAECANKVACELRKKAGVADANYNFPKGKLTVETNLSEEEIKNICLSVEEDMKFIEDKKKYNFNVSIDCAECARKVEDALNNNPNIEKAHFDFSKGKLSVTSSLSEDEIKKLCLDVEDDMEFISSIDTKKNKEHFDIDLIRIITAISLFILSEIFHFVPLAIASYLIAGYDVLYKAIRNIFKGKVFDENFLMAIATVGALVISSYEEAAGVMIFYQIGEYFQKRAVGKSRNSIANLMDLSVDTSHKEINGEVIDVKSEDVKPGDIIVIKAGEKIPLDGTVLSGKTFLDTKALTGESVPVGVQEGDKVLSGSINGEGTIRVEVTSYYADSTASKIIKLVEQSEGKKAKSEKFITRFSLYYTPFVCLSALLLAIVPPILGWMSLSDSIYRACVLLVISCPCALVLSVPLSYFASMGSFAKRGVLVKGAESIQSLAKMNTLAMDKTGTLTEGVFKVQKVYAYKGDVDDLIDTAVALEKNSTHPIAKAIIEKKPTSSLVASDIKEIPGIGIEGYIDGKLVKAGSRRSVENAPVIDDDGTHIYISKDGELLGIIVISDRIRQNSKSAIDKLKALGIKQIWMLSGDRKERAEKTAKALGMDGAYGELLPDEKLTALESIMDSGMVTGYAGDGINDAPTLKRADVGIAMGGVGSDAAIEAADIVIMNDDPEKIATAISIAKKTELIVKENIIVSLAIKALVFILAVFGVANMWLGVFADTGVTFIAVLNAMRALRWKEQR